MDNDAITRKAMPANQPLPVKYHTTKATIAAGIRIKSRWMMKIMISPIIINATSPAISPIGKIKEIPLTSTYFKGC